jgi:hypothetical protein
MGKLSSLERKGFYRKALDEQRHLLRTAIDGMAAGDLTQALHVATIVRVLVHETGASKPLLKHLDNNYLEMPIFERTEQPAPKAPPGMQSITFYCPVNEIPAEELQEVLGTHWPVCWNCHTAQTFRRERPELVVDRPAH